MKALTASLLGVALLAGCLMAGPGASRLPSPVATATPSTAPPSSSPAPTPSDDGTPLLPPTAVLTLPGGADHEARIGTYCFMGSCSDVPYWPTAAGMTRVDVPAGNAEIVVGLPDELGVRYWQARYAAGDDHFAESVLPLGSDGEVDGARLLDEARFPPPPSGEWLIELAASFDGGDATYYWYVAVP